MTLLALLTLILIPQQKPEPDEFLHSAFLPRRDGDSVVYVVSDLRLRQSDIRITGDYAVIWFDADTYDSFFEGRKGDPLENPPRLPKPGGERKPAKPLQLSAMPWEDPTAKQTQGSLPPELLRKIREIYVEGAVYFSQGPERIMAGREFYLNFTTGRMVVTEGKLRTVPKLTRKEQRRRTGTPIIVRARMFRRESSGLLAADGAEYTTCAFGKPHYHMKSDQLWIEDTEEGSAIDAYDSTFYVEDTGILSLPRTGVDPEYRDILPFQGGGVGVSKAYGEFVETKWGKSFYALGNEFNQRILGTDKPFQGAWSVDVDWRRKRGMGYGPEARWETPGLYKGRVRSYYMRDRGEDFFFYRDILVRENKFRGRVRLENRVWISEDMTFDLEFNYQKDPAIVREFFRSEYFSEKTPENAAYLRWADGNQSFTALGQYALFRREPVPVEGYGPLGVANAPPTTREALPELQHRLYQEPLFNLPLPAGTGDLARRDLAVYYNEVTTAGYLRNRPARDLRFEPNTVILTSPDVMSSWRVASRHELQAPFQAGPMTFTPRLSEEYIAYTEKSVSSGGVGRLISTAGARLSTQFSGNPTDDLLHFMDPYVDYQNIYDANRDTSELIQFDDTDSITKLERFVFGLRNRIYTRPKRNRSGDGPFRAVEAIFDLDLRLPYYPNSNRDNAGRRLGDFEADFTLNSQIESGPFRRLALQGETFYDIDDHGRLNFADFRSTMWPTDDFSIGTNYTLLRVLSTGERVNSIFGGYFQYYVGKKWHVIVGDNYDFKKEENVGQDVIFRRLGHDWVFEFTFRRNQINDEVRFSFNFAPRVLYEQGFSAVQRGGILDASTYQNQ